ncbi:DUF2892 domain-containing protein [Pseudidiomarina tainanensis]|jgi:hypothetical protein|uniref:DUF2892 domain-containing protein n=1 Tax=Pseudidiomarina tainanensis TaxID=502365 RepID=A0ACD2HEU2_9GAMM|nr:DUF2892 domain-containing protein [Pseudidiomarina tainanensis]RZQ55187.1 DUF2892 domain-containing protein [Pseudidiomarina tainanensis]
MSVEKALTAFAGFMVLLSVALTVWVHPNWVWLTVFVGANLFQQSYTGFCPASIFLKKIFKLKTERELALQKL